MSYGTAKPNFGPAHEYDRDAMDEGPEAPPAKPSSRRQLIAMLRVALDILEAETND